MRYCSRFICSLALFTVFIARLATPMTTIYITHKQDKSTMWRHIAIVLFSLIVEDQRVWFVDINFFFLEGTVMNPAI